MAQITDNNLLAIGRFSQATGLSHKALRIYDEMGLLSPSHTDPFTGYRYYTSDQVRRGQLIRQMREIEMPLRAIRDVLAASPDQAERLLASYRRGFDERSRQVHHLSRQIIHSIRQEEQNMTLTVETRELPPQQVVCTTGHVLIDKIDDYISDTLGQLYAYIQEQGAQPAGPPLGIYHGAINTEDDGPVEVCIPVEGALRASGDIRIQELPGGPAAVVTVRDEYLNAPYIFQAYDAAHDWITANGYQMAESPREIWVGSLAENGPFEIVWRYEPK